MTLIYALIAANFGLSIMLFYLLIVTRPDLGEIKARLLLLEGIQDKLRERVKELEIRHRVLEEDTNEAFSTVWSGINALKQDTRQDHLNIY